MITFPSPSSDDRNFGMARRLRFVAAGLVLLLSTGAALADVPGRVGRVAYIEGDVQAYSESDPEWKVAYVNQPITSHNSVFVGDAGRAEINVGSTTLAMEAGAQVDIQRLDDNAFDANVVRGRVSMRVRRLDAGDSYSLAVPGAEFALLTPGRYRIDALQSSGGITVFAGQASVRDDRRNLLVNAGNAMRVVGDPSDPDGRFDLESGASSPTALDDWVMAREARFRNSASERYVSPNMTGYEELDANGRWATEADVGPVWYPTTYVQSDWAPYRYGRWAYVAPWGYTWVDDAPWGFAPFHYGRWLQVGNRWGWTPGAYVARPVYAPALVGFYGGSNFSASFAFGSGPAVGWYPLAPWQRYQPHYTQNVTYVNRVNNIVINDAPPRFRGRDRGHDWNRECGGTIAPRDAFASQRSISRVAIAAPASAFDRAPQVSVNDLPRPALVPGAVRRGPEANGRPDFRSRDDATRPRGDIPSAFDRSGRPNAAVTNGPPGGFDGRNAVNRGFDENRSFDRGNDPRGNRRFDGARPLPNPSAPAIIQSAPVVPGQGPPPREVNRPRFNRDPALPPAPLPGVGEGGAGADAPQRYTPRMQAPMRSDGEVHIEPPRPQTMQQPGGFDRPAGFERPNREMRNMQAPPQNFERPQRVERQAPAIVAPPAAPQQAPAIMRPAPVAPAPQPAPVAPAAPPARAQPQIVSPAEQGQRERPQIMRER